MASGCVYHVLDPNHTKKKKKKKKKLVGKEGEKKEKGHNDHLRHCPSKNDKLKSRSTEDKSQRGKGVKKEQCLILFDGHVQGGESLAFSILNSNPKLNDFESYTCVVSMAHTVSSHGDEYRDRAKKSNRRGRILGI